MTFKRDDQIIKYRNCGIQHIMRENRVGISGQSNNVVHVCRMYDKL